MRWTSLPYQSASPQYKQQNVYDSYNRLTSQSSPASGTTSYQYNAFLTTITNAKGQLHKEMKDVLGRTVWTENHLGKKVSFSYDPQGNLIEVTPNSTASDAAENKITNRYNLRGEKIETNDPSMGRWSYNYNALGQLTQQTDAKAQSSSLQYDLLGRMITRTDTEGTTTWSYDSGTKAIGKFSRVTQSDGYIKEITYDALGRPTQVQTTINGVIHTSQTGYNAQGRVSDITYPSGLQIEQIYNNLGYLERVRRKDNQHTFWQALNSSNQFGRITSSATLGNRLVRVREDMQTIVAVYAISKPVAVHSKPVL